MALALEKPLVTSPARPECTPAEPDDSQLQISVLFTSVRSTLPALRRASALAREVRARIVLLVAQIVPYPLPLVTPPVLLDFNEKRFFTVASESHVETAVRIYLCRDRTETLAKILRSPSIVVMGGRNRWWPTRDMRLARKLRSLGHKVVFVETE